MSCRDSLVVLGYVNNEAMRFHVYVAYRVQQIRDLTNPNAWSYVDSNINPADEASRGHTPKRLLKDLFGNLVRNSCREADPVNQKTWSCLAFKTPTRR